MKKKVVLLATDRYHININDFYMFFRRSDHEIVGLLHHVDCPKVSWWRDNRSREKTREKIFDKMDFDSLNLTPWSDTESLIEALDKFEFDYVCMGNGSGEAQKAVAEHVGIDKCLFSEYGWLPWSEHFYISRKGCGLESEITDVDEKGLRSQPILHDQIGKLKKFFNKGRWLFKKDFVYVPLQVDIDDFKFGYTTFNSNEDFLDFIHEIVPKDMKVLVKRHPFGPRSHHRDYHFAKYGRFIDISDSKLNKAKLYSRMAAMIVLNSTSVLEAILFGKKVFAYGEDLFLNKGVIHFRVETAEEFAKSLNSPQSQELSEAFISLLLERQVSRRRCINDDMEYIRNHYWNSI